MSTVCDSSSLVNTSLGLRNTGVCLQEHWCILSRTYQNASPSPPSSLQTTVTPMMIRRRDCPSQWHSTVQCLPLLPQDPYEPYRGYNRGLSAACCCERRWRGEGERDRQDKLQPGEGCQSIGMLSLYLVAAARASARVSGCSCLCHLPI